MSPYYEQGLHNEIHRRYFTGIPSACVRKYKRRFTKQPETGNKHRSMLRGSAGAKSNLTINSASGGGRWCYQESECVRRIAEDTPLFHPPPRKGILGYPAFISSRS